MPPLVNLCKGAGNVVKESRAKKNPSGVSPSEESKNPGYQRIGYFDQRGRPNLDKQPGALS